MVAAVTAAGVVYTLIQGITYPLLALTLEHAGASSTAIGISAAMTPAGMLLAALVLPRLARRLPVAAVALSCFGLTAVQLLTIALVQDFWVVLGLRLGLGVCLAAIFIITSTWIHQLVDDRVRGRTVGGYALTLAVGFAAGPALLASSPPGSPTPLVVAATATALGATALFAVRTRLPRRTPGRSTRQGSLFGLSRALPVVVACIAVPAGIEQASLTLLPIYLLRTGTDATTASLAVFVLLAAAVALTLPIGLLADWCGRPRAALGCALVAAAASLLLPATVSTALLWPVIGLLGAGYFGLYTIALTVIGDHHTDPDALLAANGASAATWGLAGTVAAPTVGTAIDLTGPLGYPATLTLALAATAALLIRPGLTGPSR